MTTPWGAISLVKEDLPVRSGERQAVGVIRRNEACKAQFDNM